MYLNTFNNVSFLLFLNLTLLSFHLYTFYLFHLFCLDDNQDTQESLIIKASNNDISNSNNSIHNTTITHHNNDEILILKETVDTANYEIKVLQKKLEMSNLKLLSAQQNVFEIEENYRNSIINTSFEMIFKNKDDNESYLYDNNQSRKLNCENEILNKHENDNKHEHKHHHENYISDNEDDNINENIINDDNEDGVVESNNIQFNTDNSNSKSNMNMNTIESSICSVTESDNFNTYNHHDNIENNVDCDNHHNSNGKYNHIPIKLSQHRDKDKQKGIEKNLENKEITSSSNSNTIIEMIEFSENQNSRLQKSKEFFFSEKIVSMSKKLKILKEKLIDRRYWKQVALCVAEAAVLACASTVPIPTVDVMERSSVRHYDKSTYHSNNNNTNKNDNDDSNINSSINNSINNNNDINNNDNDNDDEYSPLFSDIRITRHLSSSRYRGSVLINEELLRTVLVMSKVCDMI
jgi:hypothetical protein